MTTKHTQSGPSDQDKLREALGIALGLITKHGLAVDLAKSHPGDMALLEFARAVNEDHVRTWSDHDRNVRPDALDFDQESEANADASYAVNMED